ncbi:MAG TPA: hypothetical protein ENN13_02805 [Candidatus Altiarchaeales archaeon]|nr:hypothetical protein [Candidatus Altiarchaeales archaeon]
MPNLDLLVFGDTAVDYFYGVGKLPELNQASDITSARRFYGGMGANTVVVANNLGLNCGLVSVIGTDAEDYRRYMESQGIKLMLKSIFGDTTKSMFFKNNGHQISFFQKGVTEKLDDLDPVKEFGKNLVRDVKSVYLARTYMGLHKKVVKEYKKSFIVWNPGYGIFKFREITPEFKTVLRSTDILIVNHHELAHLRKIGFRIDFTRGPEFFIETRGSEGCSVYAKDTKVDLKTFKTKVADESGAGDAFNAGFLAGYARGKDIYDSALIGNSTASFIVESWGCQTNLPSMEQVLERYNKLR